MCFLIPFHVHLFSLKILISFTSLAHIGRYILNCFSNSTFLDVKCDYLLRWKTCGMCEISLGEKLRVFVLAILSLRCLPELTGTVW